MQQRFFKIYQDFNDLIENIAEEEYAQKWKTDINEGSVAFGSARDNWALSIPFMKKKGVTFKDILGIYDMTEEQRKEWCWKNAPLFEVVLDMVVKHMPNPAEAQIYRIPKIWKGELDSEMGKDLLTCNPNGKLAFVITRVVIDPKFGKEIAAGRLFSGTVREGQEVYLNLAKRKQRVQQVLIYNGIKPEQMSEISAGNVLAIGGIYGEAGETVTLEPATPFQELKPIFEPVITKAIEPARQADLPKLIEVLRKVGREDPSIKIEINEETGENLMSGMGELHLEIIENRIKSEKGVDVKTSNPIIVYRECIGKKGQEIEGKSPNKHNKLYFIVEPVPERINELMKKDELPEGRVKNKLDLAVRQKFIDAGYETKVADGIKDIFNGNLLLDQTRGIVHIGEIMEMVLDMFEDVMKQGPLAKEPCMKVQVSLTDCKLHEDAIHRGPAQMYPAIRDGIRGSMMTASPFMLEPVQVQLIEVPIEFMGDVSKLVGSKRGQMLDMKQEGMQVMITAKLPVAEMIGWSSDLRSATAGRGVSSLVDQNFEKMPAELQPKVINGIKQRKGLTDAMLGA